MVKCDVCNQDLFKNVEIDGKLVINLACECNCKKQISELKEKFEKILSKARSRKMEIIMVCNTCKKPEYAPTFTSEKEGKAFLEHFCSCIEKKYSLSELRKLYDEYNGEESIYTFIEWLRMREPK